MNKQDWIILYLSVSLAVSQILWLRDARRASYLEGREAVFTAMSGDTGVCQPYKKEGH